MCCILCNLRKKCARTCRHAPISLSKTLGGPSCSPAAAAAAASSSAATKSAASPFLPPSQFSLILPARHTPKCLGPATSWNTNSCAACQNTHVASLSHPAPAHRSKKDRCKKLAGKSKMMWYTQPNYNTNYHPLPPPPKPFVCSPTNLTNPPMDCTNTARWCVSGEGTETAHAARSKETLVTVGRRHVVDVRDLYNRPAGCRLLAFVLT